MRQTLAPLIVLSGILASTGSAAIVVEPARLELVGCDAHAQLIVTAKDESGAEIDVTDRSSFRSNDPRVAVGDTSGRIEPRGDGSTQIVIRYQKEITRVNVSVRRFVDPPRVLFTRDVEPIFTKIGCNSGVCHGKASGQNGFRLSLLGYDSAFDHESIVHETRGRRIFPAAPERSLLLMKPTARVPHGGGRRLEVDSAEFRVIARWIRQGAVLDRADSPALVNIDIYPKYRIVSRNGVQRVRATARYSDGTTVDVTRLAQFQSNAPDLDEVDDRGTIKTFDGVGFAAIMARFGGATTVARIGVPLGESTPDWTPPESDNLVDRYVFKRLKELGVPPSEACVDAEFARRSSFDIKGVAPSPEEVVAYENDRSLDKRSRRIDALLETPEYADHFALFWSSILRNKRTLGIASEEGSFAFHGWIRQSIAANVPYDRFVASIVAARGEAASNPPVVWYRQVRTLEEQTDDTAQLFLGVRMQCARCHHHPFEKWTQDDYYGFASFFQRIGRKPGEDPATPCLYTEPFSLATNPATGRPAPPKPLGAAEIKETDPRRDPRDALVAWMRDPSNPYFAKSVVNRYWKRFFGRGLVEPEDDMRDTNPPSDPDLLNALAADFIASGYDLKHLIRTIATSEAYRRSSLPNAYNKRDRRNYSRFYPRRLAAEALLDAIDRATGSAEPFRGVPPNTGAIRLPDDGFASYFLEIFGRPKRESVCECERSFEPSLSQTLHLLNSPSVQKKIATGSRVGSLLAAGRDDASIVDELYRVCLSRGPTARERSVCLKHLAEKRSAGKLREAIEDLLWSLINCKEFLFIY